MWAYQLIRPGVLRHCRTGPSRRLRPSEWELDFRAAGLCGTDVQHFRAGPPQGHDGVGYPAHECVGTVTAGPDSRFIGSLALAMPVEDRGLCERFIADTERLHLLHPYWSRDPRRIGHATLIQPTATVLYAVDRLGSIAGKRAAIVGMGPAGLLFGRVLRDGGAASVVGVSRRGAPDDLARFGISEVIPPEHAHPGFDIVVEAVGMDEASLKCAVALAAKDGQILAYGMPGHHPYLFDFEEFFIRRLTLTAVWQPPWKAYFERADAYLRSRPDIPELLVSHQFPVDATPEAFHLATSPNIAGRRKLLLLAEQ